MSGWCLRAGLLAGVLASSVGWLVTSDKNMSKAMVTLWEGPGASLGVSGWSLGGP